MPAGGSWDFGEERGRHAVTSGQPFTFSYTPTTSSGHNLWFDIDLSSTGAYGATGTIQASGETYNVNLDSTNGPIHGSRVTYMWSESNIGSSSQASGNIKGTGLPGGPAGTPIDVTGTLTFTPGTTGRLSIVITD